MSSGEIRAKFLVENSISFNIVAISDEYVDTSDNDRRKRDFSLRLIDKSGGIVTRRLRMRVDIRRGGNRAEFIARYIERRDIGEDVAADTWRLTGPDGSTDPDSWPHEFVATADPVTSHPGIAPDAIAETQPADADELLAEYEAIRLGEHRGTIFAYGYANRDDQRYPVTLKIQRDGRRYKAIEIVRAHIKVIRVTVDHASKSKRGTQFAIDIVHQNGQTTKALEFSGDDLRRENFETIKSAFRDDFLDTSPSVIADFEWLLNYRDVSAIQRQPYLGWYFVGDDLVWLGSDAIQFSDRIADHIDHLLLPPKLPASSPASTVSDIDKIDLSTLSLLLAELNGEIDHVTGSVIAYTARLIVPVGFDGSDDGSAPFAIEIVGRSGVGKSPLINMLRAMFYGPRYQRNSPVDIGKLSSAGQSGATSNGARIKASMARHQLIVGLDMTTAAAKNSKIVAQRDGMISAMYDQDQAPLSNRQHELIIRDPFRGGLIMTGETDLAMAQADAGEGSISDRVCTIPWGDAPSSNSDIGNQLDNVQTRRRLAGFGFLYRQWIMRLHKSGKLIETVEKADADAAKYLRKSGFPTLNGKHVRQAIYLIGGALLLRQFAADNKLDTPRRRRKSDFSFIKWIDTAIDKIISDRKRRVELLKIVVPQQLAELRADALCNAIRHIVRSGDAYIEISSDVDADIIDILKSANRDKSVFGYQIPTLSGNRWIPKGIKVGILRRRDNQYAISLFDDEIRSSLIPYINKFVAFRDNPISEDEFRSILSKSGDAITDDKGNPRIRYDGKQRRLITLRVAYLISDLTDEAIEEIDRSYDNSVTLPNDDTDATPSNGAVIKLSDRLRASSANGHIDAIQSGDD